ncbi:MAG: hypothetical protein D8H98_17330, partial [Prevotella sp.]
AVVAASGHLELHIFVIHLFVLFYILTAGCWPWWAKYPVGECYFSWLEPALCLCNSCGRMLERAAVEPPFMPS